MMTPPLYLVFKGSLKRYVYITMATLMVIVLLPLIAIFSLGSSALSFLSHSSDTSVDSGTETTGLYQGPPVPGDTYAWGNCTYWVFYLRQQAGNPIPTTWGNAASWAFYAGLQGYQVDHRPSLGAIMQTASAANGLGHVAYVTALDPQTGAWTISEMNVDGLDIVDQVTLPQSASSTYNFIHDK